MLNDSKILEMKMTKMITINNNKDEVFKIWKVLITYTWSKNVKMSKISEISNISDDSVKWDVNVAQNYLKYWKYQKCQNVKKRKMLKWQNCQICCWKWRKSSIWYKLLLWHFKDFYYVLDSFVIYLSLPTFTLFLTFTTFPVLLTFLKHLTFPTFLTVLTFLVIFYTLTFSTPLKFCRQIFDVFVILDLIDACFIFGHFRCFCSTDIYQYFWPICWFQYFQQCQNVETDENDQSIEKRWKCSKSKKCRQWRFSKMLTICEMLKMTKMPKIKRN